MNYHGETPVDRTEETQVQVRDYDELALKVHKLRRAWYRYQRKDISQEEFEGAVAEMVEQLPRHLYKNSETIYCAESLAQCGMLFKQDIGDTPEECGDTFEQIPDDEVLEIAHDEETGEDGEEKRPVYYRGTKEVSHHLWFIKKTAKQWADEYFGVGHFSGGDY